MYHWIWITALIVAIGLRTFLHFKVEVVLGTLLYGLWLIAARGTMFGYSKVCKIKAPKLPVIKIVRPEKVSQINSVYQMSGLEVILGFDAYGKTIREDLDEFHTLIAGSTMAGKTVALNMILGQLITRGSSFYEKYDLYLFDLKSSERDYLEMWAPVISGYYALDEEGSTRFAIQKLNEIVSGMHRGQEKGIVIVIDEMAMLTDMAPDQALRREGAKVLRRTAAQLGYRGALVVATQRPHFEAIHRNVTSQLERKVCLRTDDISTAKMILRMDRNPKVDTTKFRDGEFLLKRPGRERVGRTLLVEAPGEIDSMVFAAMEARSMRDIRLKLLADACAGINQNAQVVGINKISTTFQGLHSKQIEAAYRNFVNAEVFIPNIKNGRSYGNFLAMPYPQAYAQVRQFITEGRWEEDPPVIGKEE